MGWFSARNELQWGGFAPHRTNGWAVQTRFILVYTVPRTRCWHSCSIHSPNCWPIIAWQYLLINAEKTQPKPGKWWSRTCHRELLQNALGSLGLWLTYELFRMYHCHLLLYLYYPSSCPVYSLVSVQSCGTVCLVLACRLAYACANPAARWRFACS